MKKKQINSGQKTVLLRLSFFLKPIPLNELKNSLIINGANHNRINMGGGVNQCTYKSKHIKIISTQALLTKVLNCKVFKLWLLQYIYIILYSRSSLIKHNLKFMTNIFGLSLVVSLFKNYYPNTIIKLYFSQLFNLLYNLLLIYSSLLSILYYSTLDITYSICYYSSIVINLFIMVLHI